MLTTIRKPLRQLRRKAANQAERLRRRLTAQHYGNSLPVLLNERYRRYNTACRRDYAGAREADEVIVGLEGELRRDGFAIIQNAIPEVQARGLSDRITAQIARMPEHRHRGQTRHLQYMVDHPIRTLGEEVLDLFRGPADRLLREHFGSHYRLHQVKCYRSLAAEDPKGAWLWHTDNYPPEVKKIMLYLTDCNPEQGATSFIAPDQTTRLQRAGYFGIGYEERSGDLETYARKCGVAVDIKWRSIKAGSAILFEVNTLHRANIPRIDFRDVVTFTVMPSPLPWDAALARDGVEKLEGEKTMYPTHPGQQAA